MGYCGPRGIPLSRFLSWDQHDQDAALEWAAYESRRCRSCGYHPDEHADGVHTHLDICPGCAARAVTGKKDEAKADGAVLTIAGGDRGQCPTCRAALLARMPS